MQSPLVPIRGQQKLHREMRNGQFARIDGPMAINRCWSLGSIFLLNVQNGP